MDSWYYGRGGQQQGPVSWEALVDLASSGQLSPTDLVWTASMKDWKPAGEIPGLFLAPSSQGPYATPPSMWNTESALHTEGADLPEIVPGTMPLGVGDCIARASTLVMRHFGTIILVGLVYLAVSIGASIALSVIDNALGLHPVDLTIGNSDFRIGPGTFHAKGFGIDNSNANHATNGSALNQFAQQVLTLFLSAGCIRIGLNLMGGKEASIGMIFGEGTKLPRLVGAYLLYSLMVGVGLLLFIVPGIYLAIRFGKYQEAIVDRDLGIIDALKYSSTLTTGNRLSLFWLALLNIAIFIAGLAALCVGLIYAVPLIWMADLVAYRWLQYGPGVTRDPVLAPGQIRHF